MRIKITYYVFWLLVLTILSACDQKPQPSVLPTPVSIAHEVSSTKPKPPMDLLPWQKAKIDWQQFKGVTVSVLGDEQQGFSAIRPYLPVFEALTGMRVGYQQTEQDAMRRQRTLDLKSGGGIYDVVPIGITYLGEAYQNHWLEYLDPYLSSPKLTDANWYDFADFSPKSLVLCRKDGHLLSVPFDFSAPIFFYRKDLFAKYHITVPDTYEQIITMKRNLQAALDADGVKGVYAFATRADPGAGLNPWTVIPAVRAYGGDMLDANWKPIFNSHQAVRALEVYRDMVTGYGNPPDARTLHFYQVRKMFRDGKLASGIIASHLFNEMDDPQKSPIWDKWEAHITPRGPAGRATSPWAWAFAINSHSQHKQAAWLFIQWLTSKETANLLTSGGAPARISVWEGEYASKLKNPGLVQAVQWILHQATLDSMQAGIPEFPEAGLVASQAFSEIFYGAPVQETLDKAVAQVETIMATGPTRKAALKHPQ